MFMNAPLLTMRSQVINLFLIASLIGCVHGIRFIDQDQSGIESVAKSICDLNKGTGNQIGRVGSIKNLLNYFKDLPPRHKFSACRNKYLDSIKELNALVGERHEDVCNNAHLKKIEEYHKVYVSKISKHVKYRKANQLAAPWLLIMFFMHYASATSNYCEARAVEKLAQEETNVQSSSDFVNVDRLLKQFTETLGMKTELALWNKDVFLIWNLIDNLPLESSKKFKKYLADGHERLFIRTQEADQLNSLQKFCIKQKPEYESDLLPLIRFADMGYFRSGESKLNKIPSMRRHYMMIQMCETLLPIRVLDDDGTLKQGQVVLVPVEEVKEVSQRKSLAESKQAPKWGSSFKFTIDEETADLEINTLLDTVKYREKTMNRLVKNMAKNVAHKMKSKAGQLLVRDGKKNQDYGSVMESSLAEIEQDDFDWSELDKSSIADKGGLIRNRRGVTGFFKAWVDLAFNIIDGIAFTIGIVFLYAVKVALVFIVFIYKLGRSITGIGYRPLENMFEYVWNGGFRISRRELDLTKNKNKFDFDKHYGHHHYDDYKHSKHGVEHYGRHHHHHDPHYDHHQHHEPHFDHYHEPHFDHHKDGHHHYQEPYFNHHFGNPHNVLHYGPSPPHFHESQYPPPYPHNYPERFQRHEHDEVRFKKSKSKSFFGSSY